MKYKCWKVFDGEELVLVGTRQDIIKELGIKHDSVLYGYTKRGLRYQNRFLFVETDPAERKVIIKVKEFEFTKKEDPIDQRFEDIAWHLKFKGNTFSKTDAEEYRSRLEELGIDFTSRRCADGKGYILERA